MTDQDRKRADDNDELEDEDHLDEDDDLAEDGDDDERLFSDDVEGEEAQRVIRKLVAGLSDEAGRAVRNLLERNPVGPEQVERVFMMALRVLNRREVLERILRSEFMTNVRDMQSEITEAVGIASQADVVELKRQLTDVSAKIDKLQKTLDEIVVEVDEAAE